MVVVTVVIQLAAMFGIPLLILKLRSYRIIRMFGMIGMAYAVGIAVSLLLFLLQKLGVEVRLDSDIAQIGSYAAIGVAIPLLLFNANLAETRKLSKKVLTSFLLLCLSVVVMATVCFFCFRHWLTSAEVHAAMSVGLYTGGTPNLNAVGSIMGLDTQQIAYANLSDMLIGGVFYVFLLLLAKPLLKRFLPSESNVAYLKEGSSMKNYESLEKKPLSSVKGVSLCILIAFLMVCCSALIGVVCFYAFGAVEGTLMDYLVPCLLIGVTVLGIIGSFNKHIREVEGNNLVGQYLILVFSYALASSLDLSTLDGNFLKIFLFFTCVTVGSFLLHILLAKFFRIDLDCTLITLTAGLYGPAFVPAISGQLQKEELTAPGLICGSLGYAIGTFLGLMIGYLFRIF